MYVLLRCAITRIDPSDFELKLVAELPESCDAGGDFFQNHIDFGCGSHLYGYKLK
jgi:hypothetical protein